MSSIMETQTPETPDNNNADSNNSTVDASRPFHSVKEAVAIFGKRIFFTPSPETLQPSVIKKAVSVSPSYDEFTPSPGFELASPTYELKLSPEKSPSSPVSGKTPEGSVVAENGISDSSELTTPTSEKLPTIVGVDSVMSDSSEKLINVSKEAVNPSVYEPATPSPVNPKPPNKSYPYPSPSFSWEKGVSAPPTPSISSKEIKPLPSNDENSEKDKQGKTMHGNDLVMMLMILKRLESELQETKAELKLLKERESETEIALASLNAELHKNMSKIAKAEAAEAAKAASKSGTLVGESNREMGSKSRNSEEERSKYDEVMIKQVDSPTLAQILSITDYDCYFENSQKLKKKMKKKPIIPLVTDIFPWWKKSNSTNSYAPLFSWH